MRISIVYLALASLCLCSPALADNESSSHQQYFEKDKDAALAHFDKTQEQACVNAFNSRYKSKYTLNTALAFDEPLSRGAYDQLFWKGQGSFHRGLIFTGSVSDWSGNKPGNLICYYAITDSRLDFQNAYIVPVQKKEGGAPLVSMIQSSLITLSSRE